MWNTCPSGAGSVERSEIFLWEGEVMSRPDQERETGLTRRGRAPGPDGVPWKLGPLTRAKPTWLAPDGCECISGPVLGHQQCTPREGCCPLGPRIIQEAPSRPPSPKHAGW